MKKLKSILVVFNGTETGNGHLRQAVKLASDGYCEVAVALVLPSANGKPVLVGVKDVGESARSAVARTLVAVKPKVEETEPQLQTILEGRVDEAIINVAKERECDLIIIGRGLKAIEAKPEKSFMESVTARVIGKSPIDVLVVPRGAEIKWNHVLLAIDGSRCSEVATGKALALSREFGSSLNILSVVNVPEEAYGDAPHELERLVDKAKEFVAMTKERAESMHVPAEAFVREGAPHERIVKLANDTDSNIIFMGSYGRTGLRKLFMGSVTEKVIRQASCPVYVAKSC